MTLLASNGVVELETIKWLALLFNKNGLASVRESGDKICQSTWKQDSIGHWITSSRQIEVKWTTNQNFNPEQRTNKNICEIKVNSICPDQKKNVINLTQFNQWMYEVDASVYQCWHKFLTKNRSFRVLGYVLRNQQPPIILLWNCQFFCGIILRYLSHVISLSKGNFSRLCASACPEFQTKRMYCQAILLQRSASC